MLVQKTMYLYYVYILKYILYRLIYSDRILYVVCGVIQHVANESVVAVSADAIILVCKNIIRKRKNTIAMSIKCICVVCVCVRNVICGVVEHISGRKEMRMTMWV